MFEFAILDETGRPAAYAGLEEDVHFELMNKSKELGLPIVLRFNDYYSDAEVAPDELEEFAREIDVLATHQRIEPLAAAIAALQSLVHEARQQNKVVYGLAD